MTEIPELTEAADDNGGGKELHSCVIDPKIMAM
jgi:hypothetical protein